MLISPSYLLYKRILIISTLLALCVVVLGAYVRLTDAGLGCPDWPGCYGTLTVPQSESAIEAAQNTFPNQTVEVGKAWREMAHRYLAGTLGILILVGFVFSIKNRRYRSVSVILSSILLLLVMLQAALGMWTVTMLLKPVIVTLHLIGGMSTLGLLTWMTHRQWGHYSDSVIPYPHNKSVVRIGLIILALQIFLGGWTSTNYAALACTDFPTCHGTMWPAMQLSEGFTFFRDLGENATGGQISLEALTAIQWVHRIGAMVTFVYLLFLATYMFKFWQLRGLTIILVTLLVLQVLFGIGNLVMHLPTVLAVGHNMIAALMVIVLVIINSKITDKY